MKLMLWSWISQPWELWKNKFLLFKPPSLLYFVMAAYVDQDTQTHRHTHTHTHRRTHTHAHTLTDTCTLVYYCSLFVTVKNLDVWKYILVSSVHFSSVAQSCLTLCDPVNCSTPGLPVHHQLPEFTQTQRPSSRWEHRILVKGWVNKTYDRNIYWNII